MAETFNRASTLLTTNTITDVYTAPAGNVNDRAVILGCVLANVDGAADTVVNLDITNAGFTKLSSLASGLPVPSGSSVEFIANKLVLKQGEKLRVTASNANSIDATVSALEITA